MIKRKTAYKMAIKELKRRKQRLAIDADAYNRFGFDYGNSAYREKNRIVEAIKILNEDMEIYP